MTKPVLSIVSVVIDDVESIYFYLVLGNEVIASCRLAFPREPMPTMIAGFVTEYHRGKGYWRQLFDARVNWVKQNNPKAKYIHLYVDDNNPMAAVYERIGFEYTGEIVKENGCKWMRRKLN